MSADKIKLRVPDGVAQHRIKNQIEKAKAMLDISIETEAHYNMAKASNNNWMKNTKCLLLDFFNDASIAEQFPVFLWSDAYNPEDFYESCNDSKEAITKAIQYLENLLSNLENN